MSGHRVTISHSGTLHYLLSKFTFKFFYTLMIYYLTKKLDNHIINLLIKSIEIILAFVFIYKHSYYFTLFNNTVIHC